MAVEQSLHYCLSVSIATLGSNVGTVQLPSLHSHFYLGQIFFGMLVTFRYTPTERADIGRYACKYGSTAAGH